MRDFSRKEAEMDWRNDRFRPSQRQYEKFSEDLSRKSPEKGIETGLMIFFAFLFLMPAIGFFIASAVGYLGAWARTLALSILLFGISILMLHQAYHGLIIRKIRIMPRSSYRNEAAYVGGKTSGFVTGKTAVVFGISFLLLGAIALKAAIQLMFELL
jgi:hypothetical protein